MYHDIAPDLFRNDPHPPTFPRPTDGFCRRRIKIVSPAFDLAFCPRPVCLAFIRLITNHADGALVRKKGGNTQPSLMAAESVKDARGPRDDYEAELARFIRLPPRIWFSMNTMHTHVAGLGSLYRSTCSLLTTDRLRNQNFPSFDARSSTSIFKKLQDHTRSIYPSHGWRTISYVAVKHTAQLLGLVKVKALFGVPKRTACSGCVSRYRQFDGGRWKGSVDQGWTGVRKQREQCVIDMRLGLYMSLVGIAIPVPPSHSNRTVAILLFTLEVMASDDPVDVAGQPLLVR
ncbi:hypothetical protein PM082_021560 [Marasmius tenuissimus]|nr:hypothetical protein PM082_021560 [Marasmius tenuissimus]